MEGEVEGRKKNGGVPRKREARVGKRRERKVGRRRGRKHEETQGRSLKRRRKVAWGRKGRGKKWDTKRRREVSKRAQREERRLGIR